MAYLVEDSLQFLSTELPHTYWDKEVIRNNLQSGILGNVLIVWPGQNYSWKKVLGRKQLLLLLAYDIVVS